MTEGNPGQGSEEGKKPIKNDSGKRRLLESVKEQLVRIAMMEGRGSGLPPHVVYDAAQQKPPK